MANQPSPMLPKGNEENPNALDSSLHFERMSTPRDQNTAEAKHSREAIDQSQADLVREKLVTESAEIAPNSKAQTLTTLRTSQAQEVTPQAQLASLSPEDQVQHLVNVAHASGLDHAFDMANKTNNAYVIDRFHDELVNRVLHNKQQSM